ncbi:MAG: hypothetical protein VX737_02175 [Pseudomonadota bacterium]|nr:hypothetical protein [Pseudomonadota bacterium]
MKWLQRMQELTLTPLGWFSLGVFILTVLIDPAMLYFYCSVFLVSQLLFFVFCVDPFDSCFRFWFRLFFYEKQLFKEAPLLCLRPKISKIRRSFSRGLDNICGGVRLSIENLRDYCEELKSFSSSPRTHTPRTRKPSVERPIRPLVQKTEKEQIQDVLKRLSSALKGSVFYAENDINGDVSEKIVRDIQADKAAFYWKHEDKFQRIKDELILLKTMYVKTLARDLDQLFNQVRGYTQIAPGIILDSSFKEVREPDILTFP